MDPRVSDTILRVIYYSCEEIGDDEALAARDELLLELDRLGYAIVAAEEVVKSEKRSGTLI